MLAWPAQQLYFQVAAIQGRLLLNEAPTDPLAEEAQRNWDTHRMIMSVLRRMQGFHHHMALLRKVGALTVAAVEKSEVSNLARKINVYLTYFHGKDFDRKLLSESVLSEFEKLETESMGTIDEFRSLYLQNKMTPAKQALEGVTAVYKVGKDKTPWADCVDATDWPGIKLQTGGNLMTLDRNMTIKKVFQCDEARTRSGTDATAPTSYLS